MDKISWWRTTFGQEEVGRIAESISQEKISQGSVTAEFELALAAVLDAPYVVATTSGSMALLMAVIAAGVGPGDEVIVPNRTWIATAHAPLLLGAKVTLVDVEPERPIIDVSQIEGKITPRTRAIIPSHLNGRSADMKEIHRIASRYGLTVIEDAAQAFGSRNESGMLGCQSDFGCFSLSVAKIISTGQGGFIATRSKAAYETLVLLRTHGVRDVINVEYQRPGFNFRFTDILASIGIAQVARLSDRISKLRIIYRKYAAAMPQFPFLKLLPVDIDAGAVPIYVEVLCDDRERLMQFLAGRGIQTRPFYPDLDRAAYLQNSGRFPRSRVFEENGLFLPSGPEQSLENIDRVVDTLQAFGRSR